MSVGIVFAIKVVETEIVKDLLIQTVHVGIDKKIKDHHSKSNKKMRKQKSIAI
jgi:hypothetical protein